MLLVRRVLPSCAAVCLVAALSPSVMATGTVDGELLFDGKPIAIGHVTAFQVRKFSDPRSRSIQVMLTPRPLDHDALRMADDPASTAINDEALGDADLLSMIVDDDGQVQINAHVGGVQYIESSGEIMGGPGGLLATCTANSAQRIACSVQSRQPISALDGPTWTLDVRFDTAVLSPPVLRNLADDGGDPGKALMALASAAAGDDPGAILALLSPEDAQAYGGDYMSAEGALESLKSRFEFSFPRQPRVTGGVLRTEDRAMLDTESTQEDGSRMLYAVTMERHDGTWRYVSARLLGFLD